MKSSPIGQPPEVLREKVCEAYSEAAQQPEAVSVFPVGEEFAHSVGYPETLLAEIPASARRSFAGVSNVSIRADLSVGSRILDLGCGSGLDTILAARKAGGTGRVVGVDFSRSMLESAQCSVLEAGLSNIDLLRAGAEYLPIRASTFDAAIVNGIFNLNPWREEIFRELARVLRPGGRVWVAELIVVESLSVQERESISNWFA